MKIIQKVDGTKACTADTAAVQGKLAFLPSTKRALFMFEQKPGQTLSSERGDATSD